jgi:hypothetical protein
MLAHPSHKTNTIGYKSTDRSQKTIAGDFKYPTLRQIIQNKTSTKKIQNNATYKSNRLETFRYPHTED